MKNSAVLKEELRQGKHSALFQDIYLDESLLEYQNRRYAEAVAKFEELFGEKEVEIYSAPGRSEVGGNHTDHQLGMVLATLLTWTLSQLSAEQKEILFVWYQKDTTWWKWILKI